MQRQFEVAQPVGNGRRANFITVSIVTIALTVTLWHPSQSCRAQPSLESTEELALRGRYEEAIELYSELVAENPVDAALGLARCYVETGRRDLALETLNSNAAKHENSAAIQAALAELYFARGDYESARRCANAALAIDANSLAARWIDAELLRTSGDMEGAGKAYEWFISHYNAHQEKLTHPRDLHFIGLGAAQFARWNRLHDQFPFLINSLYPDALSLAPSYWPAELERSRLFAEKFNTAAAEKAITEALKKNPSAAAAHAARAELAIQVFDFDTAQPALKRVLEINAENIAAHQLLADMHLANFRVPEALKSLERARALNPKSEATLGRLAAIYLIGQGQNRRQAQSAFQDLVESVTQDNPRPGEFYLVMADTLADFRRWPQAAEYYEEAISIMPQLIGPRSALGLLHMRLGQEDAARVQLEAAFEEDPFNVRVKNMLEVLDVLETYADLETDHFHFKFDAEHDSVLAKHLAQYMESVYPELCADFDFHPPERSLFEVFNQAKNTGGHGWFSARMVGLPYVGTVGACAGQMVAMASPDAMNTKFNWARVARHEFVHVLNLQQTNFNVPHWFTEGLAVEAEGYPRSEMWDQLLASRVPAREVFDLDSINFGFIKPSSQLDWHLAYCQAELYVQFMREQFGRDKPAAMLQAYADNLTTAEAIEACFGISQDDFEKGYVEYLDDIVADLPAGLVVPGEQLSFAEIDRAARANPQDADALAALAEAYFLRKEYPNARKFADAANERTDKHPLANYVLARLALVTGERDQAKSLLLAATVPDEPHLPSIQVLSALYCLSEEFDAAEELVMNAQKAQPGNRRWTDELAAIYLRSGDDQKLGPQLAILAEADADQFTYRKKLALMAYDEEDYGSAARWAQEAIWIDVNDIDLHEILADSAQRNGDLEVAAEEYRTLRELQPNESNWSLELAEVLIQDDQLAAARSVLEELLSKFPGNQPARTLLEQLGGGLHVNLH